MTLKEYLKKNGMKHYKFAQLVGVARCTVSNWVTGKRVPEPAHLRVIKEVTKGKVTADDFI